MNKVYTLWYRRRLANATETEDDVGLKGSIHCNKYNSQHTLSPMQYSIISEMTLKGTAFSTT